MISIMASLTNKMYHLRTKRKIHSNTTFEGYNLSKTSSASGEPKIIIIIMFSSQPFIKSNECTDSELRIQTLSIRSSVCPSTHFIIINF